MIEVGNESLVVKVDSNWIIHNEKGLAIPSCVYRIHFDLEQEPVNEIILSFPDCSIGSFLSINITAGLIGIPFKSKKIKRYQTALLMPFESKRVLPISEGEKHFITQFKIEENYIEFNTFRELTKYGKQIILKRIT